MKSAYQVIDGKPTFETFLNAIFSGPDYKKPSFEQQQSYQGNGAMQAAGGPGMGSEQVTTDTVRPLLLPFIHFLIFFWLCIYPN